MSKEKLLTCYTEQEEKKTIKYLDDKQMTKVNGAGIVSIIKKLFVKPKYITKDSPGYQNYSHCKSIWEQAKAGNEMAQQNVKQLIGRRKPFKNISRQEWFKAANKIYTTGGWIH